MRNHPEFMILLESTTYKTRNMEKNFMKTKKVVVVPYNEQWPKEFEKIKVEIISALGQLAVSVEHVGSTSVKGLWAKPIIDIDVVILDNKLLLQVINKLKNIGYHYEGNLGIEGREAFRYDYKPGFMLHHLYVCVQNSKELKRHLAFRDYLRTHSDAVQEYSQVKREGAALFPDDIEAYIQYKSPIIEKIYHCCGL